MRPVFQAGDLVVHRYNSELGVGRVRALEGRILVVHFPRMAEELRMSPDGGALVRRALTPGTRVRIEPTGEEATVVGEDPDTRAGWVAVLDDGRVVHVGALWPVEGRETPLDTLAAGRFCDTRDFANRLDALRLTRLREQAGLGSFLGGRIRLYPHQLHVAERATRSSPVRWLLADEVGLGKTVEACLVLNHLIRTRAAVRTLVVAPATLTVQWLGELYRKYHQVFVLLDEKRLADVARDHGEGFNPFDAHQQTVVALELLAARPELTQAAAEAGIDLLVVDEAHRLERAPGHPGNAAYRAVEPIAAAGRHVLLLTAAPLEEDAHGFFRLLELLRPDAFPDAEAFTAALARGDALPPCTSATRRADIGGFPPRVGLPVDLAEDEGFAAWRALEHEIAALAPRNAVERARKVELYRRVLSSPAASSPPPGVPRAGWRERAAQAGERDPRLAWLLAEAPGWRQAGEKTLVFTAFRETLEAVREAFEKRLGRRVAVFHEDMEAGRRDIEVAQFREPTGPAVLVSTECGGEGRNFEFCRRLVLYDLPWHPLALEQRIGRLDRIGRTLPVEIVYFRPPAGFGRALVEIAERSGALHEPLGAVGRELGAVERALDAAAAQGAADDTQPASFAGVLAEVHEARTQVLEGAYAELHREPYHPTLGPALLARVPAELEPLTERVVLGACERLGLDVAEEHGTSAYTVELGGRALVEGLPGVPAGRRFVGTFDREEAVARENLDFFAAGHPLVEGLLLEIADGERGRATAVALALGDEAGRDGWGLLALYDSGTDPVVVIAPDGRRRPDWEALVLAGATTIARLPRAARSDEADAECAEAAMELAALLPEGAPPSAVAAFRVMSFREVVLANA